MAQHLPGMKETHIAISLAAFALTASAAAQTPSVPFPLKATPGSTELRLDAPLLQPDMDVIAALPRLDRVEFTGITAPDGSVLTLELERIDLERRRFGFQVDGAPAPNALDGLAVSVWKGHIAGDPFSDVMLGFSNYGSRGWIRSRDGLIHVLPTVNEDGSWWGAPAILKFETDLNAAGIVHEGSCAAIPPSIAPVPSQLQPFDQLAQLRQLDTISLRECSIAMETDFQLYQNWNNLNATTAYLTTLFSFISDRYETQAATVLTFPYVQIYTNSNDPWDAPDNGGNSIDMLNEFVGAWQGNVPMNATLGHMMSGANLGGGVAYLDVLCSNQANFGVSGNIVGAVSFPVVQQPSNWDFIVVAHEIGHNFSSPHTHDFCPPLDQCSPNGFFGSCQTSQVCSNAGSIMSYCHLCNGGTANITTFFHPEAAALMTAASAACNPAFFEVSVNAPDLVSDQAATPTTISVIQGTLNSATLNYRVVGDQNYTSTPMTLQGSTWNASLPPTPCGMMVEYYFDIDVAGLGSATAPSTAPLFLYEATGGTEAITFGDNFNADNGWTTENLGASSGDWQRGMPVNDGGWDYDPASDADGSGFCYLTENENGNTDVDNGAVRLTSPVLDMSQAGTTVNYSYFLRLTNSDSTDRLLVEARVNGGAWTEVTRHDTDGGLAWRDVVLTEADFSAAGLTPSASTQMRFTANDDGTQSIVEAGLDGFTVSSINCGLGQVYCSPATVNSSGLPASISADGSNMVADNDITLNVENAPVNVFGLFVTSTTQGFVPNVGGGQGNLCIAGDLGRFNANIVSSGPTGEFSLTLDLTQMPQPMGAVSVMAGQSWNYQVWFRDTFQGTATSNLSDAVSILFL